MCGFRVLDLILGFWGFGLGAGGLAGLWVWGFRLWSLGFGIWGLSFGLWVLGSG